jgi:hypothetical protein
MEHWYLEDQKTNFSGSNDRHGRHGWGLWTPQRCRLHHTPPPNPGQRPCQEIYVGGVLQRRKKMHQQRHFCFPIENSIDMIYQNVRIKVSIFISIENTMAIVVAVLVAACTKP